MRIEKTHRKRQAVRSDRATCLLRKEVHEKLIFLCVQPFGSFLPDPMSSRKTSTPPDCSGSDAPSVQACPDIFPDSYVGYQSPSRHPFSPPWYAPIHVFQIFLIFLPIQIFKPFFFCILQCNRHNCPVNKNYGEHPHIMPHKACACNDEPPSAIHRIPDPSIDPICFQYILCDVFVHVRTDSADKPNHRPYCNEHSSRNSKYPHPDTSKDSAREYISGQYEHDGCQYEHTNGNIWSNPVYWEFLAFFHIVLNK